MRSPGEPTGPSAPVTTLAPLRGLLELSRLTRSQPTLVEAMRAVASTVAEALGFDTVVLNMFRPDIEQYEVVTVHGSERAREILFGRVTDASTWIPMLDRRFCRHGVYFIPEGALELDLSVAWYTPEIRPGMLHDERAWRADDALFATLEGAGGRRYGIISVDDPVSGLRPDDQQLEVLGALAAQASLAIESSRQLADLETALARNRAVISSALDCVIAVDTSSRVIEFNPAAEQTFGYRSEDVVGRDIAELIVAPEDRELYRRCLQRALETGDRRLLGRRIETTVMRSDSSQLPVELALTLVDGDDPVLYGFLRDISERRRGEEQLTYLAYHDSLTGLPNRILVEQQVELALARARRSGGATALMFVDLDDFKDVNDRLGHAAGDRLLAAVATRLRGVLRDSDVLARQGGDEFLVLLADLTDEPTGPAESVGGKLLEALREPFVVAGTEVRTGASIGVSLYPDDAGDTEALLRHADVAMYQAKTAGGGRLAFHERLETVSSRRTSVSTQLRQAIAAGELELHYQPVWCLNDSRDIAGVEALLRWRHPERGLLTPEDFITVAEQSTASDELIDWVLGECCRQAREWQDAGLVPIIGINVSPHQLLAPEFVGRFLDQIRRRRLSPVDFAVELTESAWTVDSAETLEVIAQLRATGVSFALDDFGAGYSSLSGLVELDFDVIKVDGRMLVGVPDDPIAVRLLGAALEIATACDSEIIAEGVETPEQVEFLHAHGIARAQGFALGYPLPGGEMTALLREHLVARPPPRRPSRSDAERPSSRDQPGPC
jgi:diguanylate cyclase (GGDEF)-like protein/PAS domain S-box-containing protein